MELKNNTARRDRFDKFMLRVLVVVYFLLNSALSIVSCIAWSTLQKRAQGPGCERMNNVDCGYARWGLYSLIAPAAVTCAVISGNLAIKTWAGAKGAPLDPLYIFRGVSFTLLVLAPFIYLGWTNLVVIGTNRSLLSELSDACATGGNCDVEEVAFRIGVGMFDCSPGQVCHALGDMDPRRTLGGITGIFIVEMLDGGVQIARATCSLTHFTLLFGALVAGMAAAMAPAASVSASAPGLSGMA